MISTHKLQKANFSQKENMNQPDVKYNITYQNNLGKI